MNIGEFFIQLGIKIDDKALDKFNKKMDKAEDVTDKVTKSNKKQEKSLGDLALGFLAITKAIEIANRAYQKYIQKAIDSSVALKNFNAQTGLSVAKLQEWQRVGSLTNLSMNFEDVTSQVQSLQENLTNIKLGGGDISGFSLLGIDVMGKDAFQVLEQIRGAIKGIDDATATNLIARMGLNPEFIRVLRLSREEFKKLGNDTFLNQNRINQLEKFGRFWKELGITLTNLKDRIIGALAGTFNILSDKLGGITDKLKEFQSIIALVLGGLAFFIAPITTSIVALTLAIEDLYTAFEGGDSFFGDLWKDAKEVFSREGFGKIADELNFRAKEMQNKRKGGMSKPLTPFTQQQSNKSATFNNTYNIQSTEDPSTVANIIGSRQQTQFNYSLSDFNNGALI